MLEIAPESKPMTYSEAMLYCRFLQHDGHNDWRLPTWDESHEKALTTWCSDRENHSDGYSLWIVTPVRDV
jgi:hypothetical protein